MSAVQDTDMTHHKGPYSLYTPKHTTKKKNQLYHNFHCPEGKLRHKEIHWFAPAYLTCIWQSQEPSTVSKSHNHSFSISAPSFWAGRCNHLLSYGKPSTAAGVSSWGCRAVNGSTLRLCEGASLWPCFAPCFASTILPGKSSSPHTYTYSKISFPCF